MTSENDRRQMLWTAYRRLLSSDWQRLETAERQWIKDQLEAIVSLQQQLQRYFDQAGGARHCRSCNGACCERGTYHVTLVNLLAALALGRTFPEPDFSADCPMLGPTGCRLDVALRPFNCVTFVCDAVESAMEAPDQAAFYAAEKQLRRLYEAFEQRYVAASMRGFLLAMARLEGRSPLQRRVESKIAAAV